MSFRPQFPYPDPYQWEEFEYVQYFDPSNAPGLTAALTAGQEIIGIPLILDSDVEFRIRGVQVQTTADDTLGIRFRDPWGNYLSDDYVPAGSYSGQSAAPIGAFPVPLETEIVCPPGAIILVDLKNLS